MTVTILNGDCRAVLATLPAGSVQCCVTSPPYFGLRDYKVAGQIGLEQTPNAYIAELVAVFREVWRVLSDNGTLWLNLGDSYSRTGGTGRKVSATALVGNTRNVMVANGDRISVAPAGLGDKQLLMIPARVALALQADGWWLRSDIIWHKPNPMPESVTDRPTSAHEHVFLLSKQSTYFYDAAAIRQPMFSALVNQNNAEYGGADTKDYARGAAQSASGTKASIIAGTRSKADKPRGHSRRHDGFNDRWDAMTKSEQQALGSNARNVWVIATQPYSGAHFATMPPALAKRCIRAGTKPGDTVLDPFGGAGTTGMVADRLGRNALLIELNPDYAALARNRIVGDAGMFASVQHA